MATSQDNSQGRRAAHFSGGSETSQQPTRTRRTPTTRATAPREAAPRTARTQANRAVGMKTTTRMSERTERATRRAAEARARRSKAARKASTKRSRAIPAMAIVAVAVVFAAAVVGFLVVPNLFHREATVKQDDYPAGEQVVVTVPDGAGGSQIAQLLVENHVISDENLFYQEVQKQNADASLKSGSYQFVTGATPSEVVKQLVAGPNATEFQLKLAEGLTVKRTAAAVEDQLGVSADDFIAQAKASNYVDEYDFLGNVGDDSLEGYLFAKTYDFGGKDITADTVIRTMLDQYQAEVASIDSSDARDAIRSRYGIEISDYGLLRVASIIEKEAVTEEDRPLVASVIYNRLSIGMAIQSDATMAYVTEGEVSADDLKTDSPYNTYLNTGLTPTPICSPSLPSIQAAMEPADTKYFYFFINENVHQFSETYEEHQQAISESLNS